MFFLYMTLSCIRPSTHDNIIPDKIYVTKTVLIITFGNSSKQVQTYNTYAHPFKEKRRSLDNKTFSLIFHVVDE